jgi:hypothetical protein
MNIKFYDILDAKILLKKYIIYMVNRNYPLVMCVLYAAVVFGVIYSITQSLLISLGFTVAIALIESITNRPLIYSLLLLVIAFIFFGGWKFQEGMENLPDMEDERQINPKKKPEIDFKKTMIDSYDQLQKQLGDNGINELTADTKSLLDHQQKLTETMSNFGPIITQLGTLLKSIKV